MSLEVSTTTTARSAGRAVARLARVVEGVLADVGLSLPQYRLLAMLAEGSQAATALADHLAVTRPSVTALVDGLVLRGLVERRPDAVDRRRVGHVLTESGQEALAAAEAVVERRLTDLAAHLDDGGDGAGGAALAGLCTWHTALDENRRLRMRA